MTGRVLQIVGGLAYLVAVDTAWAAAIGPCTEPFAYESAVNLYVLEDAEVGADEGLRDVRKRLAWLVKLDALFRNSYGSLGVHFLRQVQGEPCPLDSVIQQAALVLPPEGAAAFVDQRVYSEGNQILLQSYLRFLRIDVDGQMQGEIVEFTPTDGEISFSEYLPTQQVAFPPRQLTKEDLAAIEQAFAEASLLYPEPDLGSHGEPLPLSPDEPVPFLVMEARSDGWMRIDAAPFNQDLQGWLRADPEMSDWVRKLLPELDFLEGVIGYLSWLQVRDGWWLSGDVASSISSRARKALDLYSWYEPKQVAADVGLSAALADGLRAAMVLQSSAEAIEFLPSLVQTVQRSLPDSRLRDLLGITRLAACCQEVSAPDPVGQAARMVGLAGALNDFQAALAIDPSNDRALANLKGIYTLLERTADFPPDVQAPADVPPELEDAYARSLPRLPASRSELDARIAEIRTLQAARPEQ